MYMVLAKRTRNGLEEVLVQYGNSELSGDRWTGTFWVQPWFLYSYLKSNSRSRQKARIRSISKPFQPLLCQSNSGWQAWWVNSLCFESRSLVHWSKEACLGSNSCLPPIVFHSSGFQISSGEFGVLLDAFSAFQSEAAGLVEHSFSCCFYSYVHGVYGHLPTCTSYVKVVQIVMETATEDMSYMIHFSPTAQDSYILYPALPVLIRDQWLNQVGKGC